MERTRLARLATSSKAGCRIADETRIESNALAVAEVTGNVELRPKRRP